VRVEKYGKTELKILAHIVAAKGPVAISSIDEAVDVAATTAYGVVKTLMAKSCIRATKSKKPKQVVATPKAAEVLQSRGTSEQKHDVELANEVLRVESAAGSEDEVCFTVKGKHTIVKSSEAFEIYVRFRKDNPPDAITVRRLMPAKFTFELI